MILILLNVSKKLSNVMLANYLLVSMVSQKKCTIELPFRFSFIRASTLVVLNRYIVNFSTTKYQNVSYNGGAKVILFSFTATVHNYFWLCTIAKKKKKNFFIVHSHCFWLFYSFLFFLLFLFLFFFVHIAIVCAFTLLLLFLFFFYFLYCIHTAICCLWVHTAIVLLFLYFFLFLYIVFLFVRSYCYCSRYIILL